MHGFCSRIEFYEVRWLGRADRRDVRQRQRVSTATAILMERERPLQLFPVLLPLPTVAAAVNY